MWTAIVENKLNRASGEKDYYQKLLSNYNPSRNLVGVHDSDVLLFRLT